MCAAGARKGIFRKPRRNDIGRGCHSLPLSKRLTSPGRDVLPYPLLMVVGVVEVQRKDPALPWPFAYSAQGYPRNREGKLARAAHKYFCAPLPSALCLWFKCWQAWLTWHWITPDFPISLKAEDQCWGFRPPPPPSYFSPHHFRPFLT
jgi:hypothetical protein